MIPTIARLACRAAAFSAGSAVVASGAGCDKGKDAPAAAGAAGAPAAGAPAAGGRLTSQDLQRAWKESPERVLKEPTVTVSGTVATFDISSGVGPDNTVLVGAFPCYVRDMPLGTVPAIPGQTVVVKGRPARGLVDGLRLDDCAVVEVGPSPMTAVTAEELTADLKTSHSVQFEKYGSGKGVLLRGVVKAPTAGEQFDRAFFQLETTAGVPVQVQMENPSDRRSQTVPAAGAAVTVYGRSVSYSGGRRIDVESARVVAPR